MAAADRETKMREIETVFEKCEELSPRRFLSVLAERRGDLERVSIRPPRLGGRGMGRIVVEYRHGVHRPVQFGIARNG